MSVTGIERKTLKEQVYDHLRGEITSGAYEAEDRLPSMPKLAERFGTSLNPVQEALGRLQEEGYVEKRLGAGTYVLDSSPGTQMSDTVAVCLRPHAHVWGNISHLLAERLHEDHVLPVVVNPSSENAKTMLRQLVRSDVRAFIMRGSQRYPCEVLHTSPFRQKIIVGVIEWHCEAPPGLFRVLSDYRHGDEELARHMHEVGHRNVLLVAPPFIVRRIRRGEDGDNEDSLGRRNQHGWHLYRKWCEMGGRMQIMPAEQERSREGYPVHIDEQALLRRLNVDDPPTAIIGWRDVEAIGAQNVILRENPAILRNVSLAGYFDTPWSRNLHRPIVTVNLNVEEIVARTCEVIEAGLRGEQVETSVQWVEPRLVRHGKE